ncbi:hypothetical protein BKA69DRAFT_1055285 [Paraphysoderma sedebokerense]|nr:hypothetical protein BKA69DRAFT_1055285 [Paraphysoderma sedebokerense]
MNGVGSSASTLMDPVRKSSNLTGNESDILKYLIPISLGATLIPNLIALIVYLCIRFWLNSKAGKRLTFTLSCWICISAMLYGASRYFTHYVNLNFMLCMGMIWLDAFGHLMIVLLTSVIARQLQVVFEISRRESSNNAKWYIFAALLVAAAASGVPLYFNVYTYDNKTRTCSFNVASSMNALTVTYGILYAPVIVCICYCIYTSVKVSCVIYAISRGLRKMDASIRTGSSQAGNSGVVKKIARRLVFFCLAISATQSVNVAFATTLYINKSVAFPLVVTSYISATIQAIICAYFLITDPAIQSTVQRIKDNIIHRYVYQYEAKYGYIPLPATPTSPSCYSNQGEKVRRPSFSYNPPSSPITRSPPRMDWSPPMSPSTTTFSSRRPSASNVQTPTPPSPTVAERRRPSLSPLVVSTSRRPSAASVGAPTMISHPNNWETKMYRLVKYTFGKKSAYGSNVQVTNNWSMWNRIAEEEVGL